MLTNYEKRYQGDACAFGRVAVLCGGNSQEREISLLSGEAIYQALIDSGVNAIKVDVGHDIVNVLANQSFERVFIALHGVGGEDGKVQALLDLLNIPFTGSKHASSAIAMNKLKSKQIWQAAGIRTPAYTVITDTTDWPATTNTLGSSIFVKPVLEGSSLGMSHVHDEHQLCLAYKKAARHACDVIAEQAIHGKEFTVTLLNGVALPVIELNTDHDFYDYDAKYISETTQYQCPADLSEQKTIELQALAVQAFNEIGCSGWGRADFMQDSHGDFYLLELNTVPGMTDHSLVPMAAKALGLSFKELVLEILMQAH